MSNARMMKIIAITIPAMAPGPKASVSVVSAGERENQSYGVLHVTIVTLFDLDHDYTKLFCSLN